MVARLARWWGSLSEPRRIALGAAAGGALVLLLALVFTLSLSVGPPRDIGETATVGDVTVEIESVHRGGMSGFSGERLIISNGDFLTVVLKFTNRNAKRVVGYSGWGGDADAYLSDDLGNTYLQMRLKDEFGFRAAISGQKVRGADVYADSPVSDTLVFVRPVPAAKHLIFRAPAAALDRPGRVWLKIPREKFTP